MPLIDKLKFKRKGKGKHEEKKKEEELKFRKEKLKKKYLKKGKEKELKFREEDTMEEKYREKDEEVNLMEEEVKEKYKKNEKEELKFWKEDKVEKKYEGKEKKVEFDLKEEKQMEETDEEKELDFRKEKKTNYEEKEIVEEGITRFGEKNMEKEWEAVTRFGDASLIEQVTRFTGEGRCMEDMEAQIDIDNATVASPLPNHSNERERISEYETVNMTRWRNMSVIEEEEEYEEEEGEVDLVAENLYVFAEELVGWVLQEACLEVGQAWEMTYSQLVQRRQPIHHRHFYKTMSMVCVVRKSKYKKT